MMKHVKKILLIVGIVLCIVFLVGCRNVKKITAIRTVGSTAYVIDYSNQPYKIDELNIVSDGNYFVFEDYVASPLGKYYTVSNSKNETIGRIKLAKKSELYSTNVLTVDLLNYNYEVISIQADVNKVQINGKNNMSQKNIFICIDPRTNPLDIYLNNVNIGTNYIMPVIYNCSGVDVNLICTGANYITAGSAVPPKEYLEYLETAKDIYTIASGPYEVYSIAEDWVKEAIISGVISGITNEGAVVSGFYDSMYDSMNESLELTKQWWGSFVDTIYGKPGASGMHGETAIKSLGSIAIYGEGTLLIKGGNGSDGGNAKLGLGSISESPGGVGGNGAVAITAPIILNVTNGRCILKGGNGGHGGKGYKDLTDIVYASDGNHAKETKSNYYYSNEKKEINK